ncbi:MAG: TIGR01620 family protein, partial [Rhizobiales bacterium]|nr:TIGR01620 family protein [Hyphomicrobiales bacterium]
MNDRPRKPAAFSLPPDATAREPERSKPRAPAAFEDAVTLTPDADDPFIATTAGLPDLTPPVATPRRRRVTLGRIVFGALGVLVSLAVGLWVDALIRDLFSRNDWLGYLAIAAAAAAVLALLGVVLRELIGLRRLAAVQDLKHDVLEAAASPSPSVGRAIVADVLEAAASPSPSVGRAIVARLVHLLAARPQTARGRARLAETENEIIDAAHLIDLAERELMAPLDREARALILGAAKRVSIVTAVSPRALVDLGYVIYESSRLVRGMAELYGGRPGKIGMMRLMRDVIAHLAVTGSIAMGDSLVQQVL